MDSVIPTVLATELPNGQHICQIKNIKAGNLPYDNTELIVVFDISASMGSNVAIIHKQLQNLIPKHATQKITVVTFGRYSIMINLNHNQINNWHCPELEGSTQLCESIRKVFTKISNSQTKTLFQITIISDGDVFDLDNVLDYVSNVKPNALSKHIIQVSAIRIGSRGDTRALSCFYAFHNHPTSSQMMIDTTTHNQTSIENALADIFKYFNKGLGCYASKLVSASNNLVTYPFDTDPTNLLDINNNDYFICKTFPSDLKIDGVNVIVTERNHILEADILDYLKVIEMKVRNLKVLGVNKQIPLIVPFLNDLNKIMSQDLPLVDQSNSKMAQIRRSANKMRGTIINTILQLVNLDNVHKLNSEQQASFLRDINQNTQTGRRLAKRSAENESDILTTLKNNVSLILNSHEKSSEESALTSFYSLVTSSDILTEAVTELKDDIDMFSLEDLLRCFGQVGLCFEAAVANYPDPWQFKVRKVYPGIYLAQHDIYEALVLGSGSHMKAPGSNSDKDIITGVDVIQTDSYVSNREVNKIHCSISMRRVAAIIPNDDIALKTAVIFQLANQVVELPLEVAVTDLWSNIQTLKQIVGSRINSIFVEEVVKGLLKPNMDAYFTGDLGVSSINKIVGLVLVHNKKIDLRKLARSLLSLDAYHHVRSKTISENKIHEIFQIDISAHRTNPSDPFEPEPVVVEFYDGFDSDIVIQNSSELFNEFNKIIGFIKFLHAYSESNSVPDLIANIKKYQTKQSGWVFGIKDISLELFVTAHTIQAILAPKLEYRVDTVNRRMLLPSLLSKADLTAYFKSVVQAEFKADYEIQLALKHKNETERKTIMQIEKLIWSCDTAEFIRDLNEFIGQRDSATYPELISKMKETADIPLLREKIWILAMCKTYDDTDTIVWNRGNLCTKNDMGMFESMWSTDPIKDIDWDEFYGMWSSLAWTLDYHNYRDGVSNRHGHCNICPYSYRDKNGYWKAKVHNRSDRSNPKSPDDYI